MAKCDGCPANCLGTTPGFGALCEFWASGEPVKRAHVVARSALGVDPEEPPRPMPGPGPGLLTKVANFAGAVVGHVAAGLPAATDEEASRRLALCRACPEHFDPAKESCDLCGCSMPLKVTWAEQRCPIGKW